MNQRSHLAGWLVLKEIYSQPIYREFKTNVLVLWRCLRVTPASAELWETAFVVKFHTKKLLHPHSRAGNKHLKVFQQLHIAQVRQASAILLVSFIPLEIMISHRSTSAEHAFAFS